MNHESVLQQKGTRESRGDGGDISGLESVKERLLGRLLMLDDAPVLGKPDIPRMRELFPRDLLLSKKGSEHDRASNWRETKMWRMRKRDEEQRTSSRLLRVSSRSLANSVQRRRMYASCFRPASWKSLITSASMLNLENETRDEDLLKYIELIRKRTSSPCPLGRRKSAPRPSATSRRQFELIKS